MNSIAERRGHCQYQILEQTPRSARDETLSRSNSLIFRIEPATYTLQTTLSLPLSSQIRLMIAAAALTSRKVLPETAMDMALLSPYFINLPLAPAEGLIVVNSGFERNGNGQVRMLVWGGNYKLYPLLNTENNSYRRVSKVHMTCPLLDNCVTIKSSTLHVYNTVLAIKSALPSTRV